MRLTEKFMLMQNVLSWLNTYNVFVTAVLSLAIALSTVVTTCLTRTLAVENRLLRKAGTDPEVVAYLVPDARFPSMINFVLANIGQGPALNVRFTFHADAHDFTSHNVQLSNRSDRKAISTLPQGERVVAFFGAGHELYTEPRLAPFRVKVQYVDLLGKSHDEDFELDVSQFAGLIHLGSPPEQEVAQAMKTLAAKVEEWTSGSRRLRVEVITAEQFRRHQQEVRRVAREHLEGGRSRRDDTA